MMPEDFKVSVFLKKANEDLSGKNNLNFLFFKKIAICVNGEYAKRRNIYQNWEYLGLIIEQHGNKFRSSLSILERSDKDKKPFYTTVPFKTFLQQKMYVRSKYIHA